jgi:hypothetical protein
MSADTPRNPRAGRWLTLIFAAVILIPSLYGFGSKFAEFIAIYRGEVDGAFAIAPIGFLLLFLWAACGGMFHDLERPKYTMLENERLLDELERQAKSDHPLAH